MSKNGLKLGSLGGAQTFGDQAARLFLQHYPEFTEIVYFPNAEDAFDALLDGKVAAMCAPEQMSNTGFHPRQQAYIAEPGSPFHVVAEITHEYHCSLLGKPGTTLAQLRRVIGHTGSVTQSRRWLEKNLPGVEIEIVHTNSRVAAKTVLDGDGSTASVGTPAMAGEWGLVELAKEIDGGSVGNYWAISRDPRFDDQPTRVVVAGRFADDGQLSGLICAMANAGYTLQTICAQASGKALYEYDDVLRFRGAGTLAAVRAALGGFKAARLAGAFLAR